MNNFNEVIDAGVNIHYVETPIKFSEIFPLKNNVYVIDNYLSTRIHHWLGTTFKDTQWWAKTNRVRDDDYSQKRIKTGLPYHELWGSSILLPDPDRPSRGRCDPDHGLVFQTGGTKWLDKKLRTDFGFDWVRFQYAGLNSQTYGQDGTIHTDTGGNEDYNCSFLYYYNKFWFDSWGGNLNLYNDTKLGENGKSEWGTSHKIGSIEFKPNRLLVFDGRIPHQADSPHHTARYIDRGSLVIRGDEIRLLSDREIRYAYD